MFSNSYQAVIANDDSLPGQFYPGLAELHAMCSKDAARVAAKRTGNDFAIGGGGSIYILTPLSSGAEEWCNEHLPEDAPRWGRNGYAIEHRYIRGIVSGIVDAGFSVTGSPL